MREAVITTDIYRAGFNCGVGGIEAWPVAAKMAQMPPFADEPIFLLLSQSVEQKFGNDAEVENDCVFAFVILPGEAEGDMG